MSQCFPLFCDTVCWIETIKCDPIKIYTLHTYSYVGGDVLNSYQLQDSPMVANCFSVGTQ
uniref:Uncharacterized protein n=1 Tax=Anguilla anguilla TaxID=7936 RepID=A0A0E9QIZ4_ANGAN